MQACCFGGIVSSHTHGFLPGGAMACLAATSSHFTTRLLLRCAAYLQPWALAGSPCFQDSGLQCGVLTVVKHMFVGIEHKHVASTSTSTSTLQDILLAHPASHAIYICSLAPLQLAQYKAFVGTQICHLTSTVTPRT
jgi:hypothetical protein